MTDISHAVGALSDADPALALLIERIIGSDRDTLIADLSPRPRLSPFQALLRAIVYQQLSGKAAAAIHQRLKQLFANRRPTPVALLALPDDALRGAGLSRNKIAAARDLAAKVLDGTVPSGAALRRLDDEAIIERLITVRGIGRWTVEMMLMFDLGRPDVLPVADLGVRKGFMLTYKQTELPSATVLSQHAERYWRPYRSAASWFMWRATELTPLPD